jgi:Glu-tRNA(Gln) amidotransferase subunit E-like FAD-binding protein
MNNEIKAGLEIHQQLDTNKLFCDCPSLLRSDDPSFKISRKLHAVAGEGGEIDIAARYEVEKDKRFTYHGYDTTCLVELDEEPPHLINKEALRIGLHISLLLNCEILPLSQIMRKTVVDGSNTSGFQRTVLIARNGWIKTSKGKVSIDNVNLEEDSARIVGNDGGDKVFRLDRLGIPLIEIGTGPDIKSSEQAKEAALILGDILRSCKVRRGIGTIRQDVNVSIEGHPRIEIKGFQDVKMFVPTIEEEVKRQNRNLKSKKKLESEVRNALSTGKTEFLRPMPGAARMYPETDLPLLRISREIINDAKRTLPKLRSEVREELSKEGLREDEIKVLFKEDKLEEFESLLKILRDPRFVFKILIEIPRDLSKKSNKSLKDIRKRISLDVMEKLISSVVENKFQKEDITQIIENLVSGKSLEDSMRIEKADLNFVRKEIEKIVKAKPGLSIGGYMGLVMNKFKGKVSGKDVNEILNKLLK